MAQGKKTRGPSGGIVTLKTVAEHVSLSPGTVSAVLNNAPSAEHIPEHTRSRILAARELNYRPNFFAHALRKKRTYTIGVIAHDIGEGYSALVIGGIENYARQKDYFFIPGIHRHDPELFERYSRLLLERGVEGFITVDLNLAHSLPLPTVAVSGHGQHEGVTNIVLDHRGAARLALQHLVELGHREIALMRGTAARSDSEGRWHAIGAMRAFQEAGLRVPADISVVGFDDI
jgi:DNA-binding LacI/PurR family transcriptional regulator